ncbi:hypothetical protein BS50DRAFT_146615 [Corynespora cassiicola Philippines]|uniref:Uncharacterized protein n=1 Tax=Corynespora cassiicola Philippines TaxID=1448308 RepID=A0A2T2N8T0_CORCC|nr:hypothetical protein BS50DRAFT_146615 [Corynespora cassiicola Philippines]
MVCMGIGAARVCWSIWEHGVDMVSVHGGFSLGRIRVWVSRGGLMASPLSPPASHVCFFLFHFSGMARWRMPPGSMIGRNRGHFYTCLDVCTYVSSCVVSSSCSHRVRLRGEIMCAYISTYHGHAMERRVPHILTQAKGIYYDVMQKRATELA